MSADRGSRLPTGWPALRAAWVVAGLLAGAAPAAWASAQPLIEPDRIQLLQGVSANAGDPASIHQAILEGAAQRSWRVKQDTPGKMTLVAQTQTHIATVDVIYDGSGFQIRYQGSVDMDYAVEEGHPVIHPRYNRWISTLGNEIRRSAIFRRKPLAASAPAPGASAVH
jgi:hypothetical protein